MTKKTEYSIFIGRFQPLHLGHIKIIDKAKKNSKHVIVAIGSHRASKSIKNPWTYEERKEMIHKACGSDITIIPIKDYLYNDLTWITSLQNKIVEITNDSDNVDLYGHFKDDSSYYLNFFPQWRLQAEPNYFGISSTDIRRAIFEGKDDWIHKVDSTTFPMIIGTDFQDLEGEYKYIMSYKDSWSKAPYPPTFVTVDSVIIQGGHILLIKRGCNPGKGKYALPGGFLNQDEFIFQGAVRELKEETNIDLPVAVLERSFVSSKVFDHPKRSLRGRTITHAHLFKLDAGKPLPRIKAGDDANVATWVQINELNRLEEFFFEDHLSMIEYFLYSNNI